MPDSALTPVDVLVLGAGLSGLVAARRLVRGGLSVRVLEARDRVGGRTLSIPLGRGWADLGGQWMSPTQTRLTALARELGVATFPQHRDGRVILAQDDDRPPATWLERVPGFAAIELWYRSRALDRMSRSVSPDHPESAPLPWRHISVAEWLTRHVRTRAARDGLRLLLGLHLGAEPEDVSLLYFLHFLRVTSGMTGHEAFAGSLGETRFVGGAQRLCLRLADMLGAPVLLGQRVTRIVDRPAQDVSADDPPDRDPLEVWVDERCHRARYALLAMAPALIDRLTFSPPMPESRRALARAASHSPVIKCALAYRRPFWREARLSGEAYHAHGPVRAIIDHTSDDGQQPALLAFIVGRDARELSGATADERAAVVIDAASQLFGAQVRDIVDYRDKDWPADPLSAGCVAIAAPGAPIPTPDLASAPLGRVHFAGTETARHWPHYLEGAIEAGERAADEILARAAAAAPTPGDQP